VIRLTCHIHRPQVILLTDKRVTVKHNKFYQSDQQTLHVSEVLTSSGIKYTVLHSLVAGLLARSQYPEGPATGHLGTGVSWFPCVYKRMLRWFPTLQVATACFLCSPPDLNFLDP